MTDSNDNQENEMSDDNPTGHTVNDRRKRTPLAHRGPSNAGQEDFEKRQAEEAERQEPKQLQFPGMEDAAPGEPVTDPAGSYQIEPPTTVKCRAAFIIYQDENGKFLATSNMSDVYEPEIVANLSHMTHGCSEVLQDIQILNTTHMIVNAQQQTANMMMEQQRNAQMAQRLQQQGINIPQGR